MRGFTEKTRNSNLRHEIYDQIRFEPPHVHPQLVIIQAPAVPENVAAARVLLDDTAVKAAIATRRRVNGGKSDRLAATWGRTFLGASLIAASRLFVDNPDGEGEAWFIWIFDAAFILLILLVVIGLLLIVKDFVSDVGGRQACEDHAQKQLVRAGNEYERLLLEHNLSDQEVRLVITNRTPGAEGCNSGVDSRNGHFNPGGSAGSEPMRPTPASPIDGCAL